MQEFFLLYISVNSCLFVSREQVRERQPGEDRGRAVGTDVPLLDSEGDTEMESSPEGANCDSKDRQSNSAVKSNSQGETTIRIRRGIPCGRKSNRPAVSRFGNSNTGIQSLLLHY